MAHILWEMFYWPGGIVVGNLIANVIWDTPGFIHAHRQANRHHKERLAAIRNQSDVD